MQRGLKRWWRNLTWQQIALCALGVGGLYLWREHLPTDPDGWKEWIEVAAAALTAAGVLGSLTNGRSEAPKEEP